MATFRSLDSLAQAMLEFLRVAQPDLDTKPGTVARDLFVDLPATELAKLYIELKNISGLQAIGSAVGSELDRLARNFGIARKQGSAANGAVVLTVSSVDGVIIVPSGTLIVARNGASFRTQNEARFEASRSNLYRANASRLRTDLSLANISDEYALEVAVEAVNLGASGNIGKYGILSQNVAGVSNVTNTASFSGGSGQESDDQFRGRVLSVFSGANLGTTLGYESKIKADSRVIDVLTVEPGDVLMTRDGTEVTSNSSGESIIVSSGTGGKVDVYIQGSDPEETVESYIYKDLSGKNDPTHPSNDYILGQRGVNPLLDYQQKRRLLMKAGTLPYQPIQSIVSISGSLSGPNFIEKFTDSSGNTRGNFELVKDSGSLGGSVFGMDKIRFTSKNIEVEDESISKGIFNGHDGFDYTDVSSIAQVYENFIVTNENPVISSTDRSILTLSHTPIVTVDRVVNLTTGDRYAVVNANLDGVSGELNETGRIKISGSSLPASSHILQVTYVWKKVYDGHLDYDDLIASNPVRIVQDSVDWGYANRVISEEQTILHSGLDGYHVITELPISRVTNVNSVLKESVLNIAGKLTVSTQIESIASVKDSVGREVFYTKKSDGSFSGYEVTLPTDSLLLNSDLGDYPDGYVYATVTYNSVDLYSPDGYDTGSFSGNTIYLTSTTSLGDAVYIDYVANVVTLVPTTTLANLPATRYENSFLVNGSVVGSQPTTKIVDGYGNLVSMVCFSPTHLKMTFSGVSSVGRLSIRGTSHSLVSGVLTARRNGLTIDLSDVIKDHLDVSTIPSTVRVASVSSVERVTVSDDFVQSDFTFDVLNQSLKSTEYSNSLAFADASLSSTEVKLRATEGNVDEQPTTGEKFRVQFYIYDTSATERLTVSSSGVYISANKYVLVEKVSVDSGFVGVSSTVDGSVLIEPFTQPLSGSSYFAGYNYIAPKEGERLTIRFSNNKLISDLMFDVEPVRPITSDVLIKEAKPLSVDIDVSIVPIPSFANNTANLQSSVAEGLTTFLTSGGLNQTLDHSDVVNSCYGISGVDRVIITKFNASGLSGIIKTITAGRNEFIVAGTINVTIDSR